MIKPSCIYIHTYTHARTHTYIRYVLALYSCRYIRHRSLLLNLDRYLQTDYLQPCLMGVKKLLICLSSKPHFCIGIIWSGEEHNLLFIWSSHSPLPFVTMFPHLTWSQVFIVNCASPVSQYLISKNSPQLVWIMCEVAVQITHQLILCKFTAFLSEIGTIFKFDKGQEESCEAMDPGFIGLFLGLPLGSGSPVVLNKTCVRSYIFSLFCSFMVVWGLGLGFWGWSIQLMGFRAFWVFGVGALYINIKEWAKITQ